MNGTKLVRILLVDDHVIVREAIATLISMEADLRVVGQVGTRSEAHKANLELTPDLILLDFQLADGAVTSSIRGLLCTPHKPKVLVLSSFAANANVFAALDAGASGYLLKSAHTSEVLQAIRRVAGGGVAYAKEAIDQRARLPRALPLTQRELHALALVAEGNSNEQMARALGVSVGTIKTHLHNAFEKLGAHSRMEAIAIARSRGMIPSL